MATKQDDGRLIRVMATQVGYYDHVRRREGDVFSVPPAAFSKRWMQRVAPETPERQTTGKQHLKRMHDDILSGKVGRQRLDGILVGPDDVAGDPGDNPLRAISS